MSNTTRRANDVKAFDWDEFRRRIQRLKEARLNLRATLTAIHADFSYAGRIVVVQIPEGIDMEEVFPDDIVQEVDYTKPTPKPKKRRR